MVKQVIDTIAELKFTYTYIIFETQRNKNL